MTSGIAARICNDLILNNYSDWFLPSHDELNKLYINKVAIGGFTSNDNWSSSENNIQFAYYQNFSSGAQSWISKDNTFYVRAIRAF